MNLHEIFLASQISGKSNGNGESADLSDYYTKSQTNSLISEKVAEIVANAPEDFDTLKEISDWISGHEDSAAAMNSAIAANTTAITTKVDKVSGKGLSTNDFTNADKSKLDSLENYDDTEFKADVSELASQAAINKSTLGYQSKNLLMNNCKTETKSGVTATVNTDGSITLSGQNASASNYVLYGNFATGNNVQNQFKDSKKFIPNGSYLVSGGITGCGIQVCVSPNGSTVSVKATAYASDVAFSITDSDNYVWGRLLIMGNADFSTPVTIYPMIRPAEVTESTYEPYRPSVAEYIANLEARINALELANQEEKI